MLVKWLQSLFAALFPRVEPKLSKNARRRLEHTSLVSEDMELCSDGWRRPVRRLRLDMSYLDRSKYRGDGSPK